MKNYRPLLLQKLDVRLSGLHLRRLRLNRHLPDADMLSAHSHPHTQILCYLAGQGVMTSAGLRREVHPGTVVMLPPRCAHAFEETSGRRPLCLVLDLDWLGAARRGEVFARLTQSDAGAIRAELSSLTRLHDPDAAACRLLVAAAALRILDVLFRTIDLLPPRQIKTPRFVRDFERALDSGSDPHPPIAQIARAMGYQPDYLNRIFKQATGQTLREYRDARLIARAKRLLAARQPVGEVAAAIGILDQNYFSRWFRKHTGLQPRALRDGSDARGRPVGLPRRTSA